jgi:hypothetical protein
LVAHVILVHEIWVQVLDPECGCRPTIRTFPCDGKDAGLIPVSHPTTKKKYMGGYMEDFIDSRIEAMLLRPSMWGSHESVELLVLQLVELLFVLNNPGESVQVVLGCYVKLLMKEFPKGPPTTLTSLLGDVSDEEFSKVLRKIVNLLRQEMLS